MKTHNFSNCVILDPGSDHAPAIVVYGGLYGWEGSWLTHRIPLGIRQSAIFVLPTHYTNDCGHCLKRLRATISPDRISSYSLCGYSRGGIAVYQNLSLEDWKILGLIDPSAPRMGGFADSVLDAAKSKIRCVYRMANWKGADYFPKIESFHNHLVELKVKMVDDSNTAHAHMPTFFFETYGQDF
jgi:hypothetical protein